MKKTKNTPTQKVYTGTVDHVSINYAYIIVDALKKDVLVPSIYLKGAMHQDIIRVILNPKNIEEGRIIKIVKRAHKKIVGRINIKNSSFWVMPDHKRLHYPIKVSENLTSNQLEEDDKVIISITEFPTAENLAEGKIKTYLGPMGSHNAETQAIIAQFQLEEHFSSTIEKTVNEFPNQLSSDEIDQRADFRNVTTFTIDPQDAKDFDDALSLKKHPNGDFQVGIHVADVTHYVKPNTPLDQEAQRRAISVYLVGHTVPMLPERLSNDLCSLKPHVDRPAFSLIATLNTEGEVKNIEIKESIIHSNHRFTYDEAHHIIEQKKGIFYEELSTLDFLAKKLRKQRIQKGAICFESTDVKIKLDKEGSPVDIKEKKAHTTHQLIEEFMLLANRLIAATIWNKKKEGHHLPFIYRTHDKPEAQKVIDFARFLKTIGYNFNTNSDHLPQSYNKVLEAIRGTAHESIVQMLSIRTMSQASYSNVGNPHFGLAFRHYTHFTSPIRRYPDLIVHRLVKNYLIKEQDQMLTPEICAEISKHASDRERIATEAERTSISCKQAVFVKKFLGKVLEGTVSGMTEWGLYVELKEYKCEGMIRLVDLPGDYYVHEPTHFRIRGKRKGKTYQMGDQVRVLIKNANIAKRQIDMLMA